MTLTGGPSPRLMRIIASSYKATGATGGKETLLSPLSDSITSSNGDSNSQSKSSLVGSPPLPGEGARSTRGKESSNKNSSSGSSDHSTQKSKDKT